MASLRIVTKHIWILCLIMFSVYDVSAQKTKLSLVGAPNIHLDARVSGVFESVAMDDDNSTELKWQGAKRHSKVTVSTFSPGQRFDLIIEATNTKNGVSSGQIQLRDGMMPTDLIVNLRRRKKGHSRIRYLVQASIEQGHTDLDVSDIHHISFTMTDQ